MKSNPKKLIAIFGLVAGLSIGTSCHEAPKPQATELTPKVIRNFTPRMERLANRIFGITPFAAGRFADKPPYTYGFAMPVDNGGKIEISAQSHSLVPDASRVEAITVVRSGAPGKNFDLSFLLLPDNTWSAFCTVDGDPYQGISEVEQQRALLDKQVLVSPAHAEVVLDTYISFMNSVTDTAQTHMPNLAIPVRDNPCRFTMGDGDGSFDK